jgi:hypothetical protein
VNRLLSIEENGSRGGSATGRRSGDAASQRADAALVGHGGRSSKKGSSGPASMAVA